MTPENQTEKGRKRPPGSAPFSSETYSLWPSPLVPRPVQNEVRRLREENDNLREELAEQRVALTRAGLALEYEHRQRVRIEATMHHGYQDFAGWFETASFAMTCVGSDGVIDRANNQQLNLLGYSRTEYVGHRFEEFVLDGEVLEAVLGGRVFQNRATSMRCRNGETKPVLISTEPFHQGPTHGICCYVQDMSEVLATRSEQRRSEQLFRQLAENIREVFWMSTPDKKEMLYVSPAYEMVWGRGCESLYQDPASFLDGIVEEDRERVRAALPLQATEGAYCEEYRVVRPEGTIRWVRDRAFPVRDDKGEVFRIAGLAEDITEIKEAEARLERQALRQKVLAEVGNVALTETSLQNVFDRACEELAAVLDVEFTTVLEFNWRENDFLLRAGVGWKPGLMGGTVIPGGDESQAGFTLLSGEPVTVEDISRESRFKASALLREHGVVSGVTVVIERRAQPFGVLGVHSRNHRRFTADDVNFLQAVANILAAAVERNSAERGQQEVSIELARQRQRLNEILKNMPAIVWELRLDRETGRLRQQYTSDFAATMIGFTKEECMGNPDLWLQRMHPEDRDRVQREMTEVMSKGTSGSTEFRWIARQGHVVWAESTTQAFRDDAGNIAGLRGVAVDITERKLEEAKRHEAEERFLDMLRNLPGIVWEVRIDPQSGCFVPAFLSGDAEALLGYPKSDWLESVQFWLDRVHPEDRPKVEKQLEYILRNQEPLTEQFRWIARDGRVVWVESRKRVIRDHAGRSVGIRGVTVDITARKQAEAQRAETEERIRDILTNVPGVVWEMRLNPEREALDVVFVSDYAETMSGGYTKEDFLKDPDFWIEHVHPDDREMVRQRMMGLLKGKNTGRSLARWLRRDGKTIWIETTQRVVRETGGKAIGLRGVTLDVTARKRAEAEREAAEQRFHSFMDHSPVVALMKDENGRYIFGNKVFQDWCESLGVKWYQRTDDQIFPRELAQRYRRLDLEALEKNATTQTLEISYDKHSSPQYWTILRFPIVDPAGRRILGTVAIDVTERRRLERELLEISDREQRRLGQELHDGLCQHLLGIAMLSNTLAGRMRKANLPETREVQSITDFLYEALGLARGLMRGSHLVNMDKAAGLPLALEEFAATTSKLFDKEITFEVRVTVQVTEPDVATHLFRIAQEATHNAIKHGHPRRVSISLDREGDDLVLKVENDGEPLPAVPPRSEGMGIRTMKYRADLIGADLQFNNRPEGGVVVTCRLPAGRGIKFGGR